MWDCRRNQTFPGTTAFKFKVKVKYKIEKFTCIKTSNMEKF